MARFKHCSSEHVWAMLLAIKNIVFWLRQDPFWLPAKVILAAQVCSKEAQLGKCPSGLVGKLCFHA